MKKNTVKIIIASLLITAVGAVGGMGISACINNSQKAPEQTIVATEKAEKKNSDSDKTKETKVETQAPTVKATVKPTATPKKKVTTAPVSSRKKYVLNTKTMKFQLPSCSEAERISAENKKTTTTTRESLISQGYEACQKCNP